MYVVHCFNGKKETRSINVETFVCIGLTCLNQINSATSFTVGVGFSPSSFDANDIFKYVQYCIVSTLGL